MSNIRLRVDGARLSFPDLFEPKEYEAGGSKRYSATLLVEPHRKYVELGQDGKPTGRKISIEEAIDEVGKETFEKQWPALKKQWEGNSQKFCYIDGDLKEYDGYAGMWALSAHRREVDGPPTVVHSDRSELTATSGKPYAGCYVTGTVELWGQKHKQHAGIRCALRGIQFVRDGDAFAGSRPSKPEEFEDLGVPDEGAENLV